jgi:hypothetical protein
VQGGNRTDWAKQRAPVSETRCYAARPSQPGVCSNVTTTSTNQSKIWVIAAACVVAIIGAAAWLLGRPSDSEQAEAANDIPSEPATPLAANKPDQTGPTVQAKPAATAAAKPAAPQPTAAEPEVDLFADAMPDFMVDIHAKVLDKKWLGVEDQKKLYNYGKEHRDDARPQLILAWDARNREWDGMAITVYGTAFRADPRARQDKTNLRDLLDLASKHDVERVEFKDALDIVKQSFGLDALPVVEEQLAKLEENGQLERAARLSQMRDALRGN